jgi:hypothetical protein
MVVQAVEMAVTIVVMEEEVVEGILRSRLLINF